MSLSKKTKILSIFLILLLLFTTKVYSLGISPAIQEIRFKPGLTKIFEVQIFGEDNAFDVKLGVSGDLEEYITLPTDTLTIPSEGASFEYEISLPTELKPGRHKTSIIIEQQPKVLESGAGKAFGARAAVGHVLAINVPYEDKYAEATIDAPHVNVGQPINFEVTLTNYGNEDIDNAKGIIDVFDGNDNKVITIETDSLSVKQGESTKLYAHWTPKEVKPGVYKAKVIVYYDDKQTEAKTSFLIGDIFIDIIDLSPKEIEQGKIQKLNIAIKSFWSREIKNIYGHINISQNDEKKEILSTPQINLNPWKEGTIFAFLDTTNYDLGEYKAKVILNYQSKTTVKDFKLSIKSPKKLPLYPILLISILIMMNIVAIVIFFSIKKKNKYY